LVIDYWLDLLLPNMADSVRPVGTHAYYINKVVGDSSSSSRNSLVPSPSIGSTRSKVTALAHEGEISTELGSGITSSKARINKQLNREIAEAEEEIQDHEPYVTNVPSRAKPEEIFEHQIIYINRMDVEGADNDKMVNVSNIASLNIMLRREFQNWLKHRDNLKELNRPMLTTSQVSGAMAIQKRLDSVKDDTKPNDKDINITMWTAEMTSRRESNPELYGKYMYINGFRSNSTACALYAPLFLERWHKFGVLQTFMQVMKVSRTIVGAGRSDDDRRGILAVVQGGRVEMLDIWPYKKGPGTQLYLLLTGVPYGVSDQYPLQIVPWCTSISPLNCFPDIENLFYKDVGGEQRVLDAQYFGMVLDDNGHAPPKTGLVFTALGININDDADKVSPSDYLSVANAAYAKLPTIKVDVSIG
jgi:hypothetical protein